MSTSSCDPLFDDEATAAAQSDSPRARRQEDSLQGTFASIAPAALKQLIAGMPADQLSRLRSLAFESMSLCQNAEEAGAEIGLVSLCNYELWLRRPRQN